IFTVFSLTLFSFRNKVEFVPGLILGAGSFVGGYVGSYLNTRINKKVIRYVVAGMMIFSAMNYIFS
ncbi:MAG: TSUP family transporter, partial [Fervidobacterium pennivorans]